MKAYMIVLICGVAFTSIGIVHYTNIHPNTCFVIKDQVLLSSCNMTYDVSILNIVGAGIGSTIICSLTIYLAQKLHNLRDEKHG